ncbi:NAD(P)/FAD-dependent oxidoreductase [Corallococcus exercitus]|uniref:NAD(P)/FAD-dependent oxidoreductase n=1 Tax=Corallococcus exercitus TaxID=2316736 RepID=UPI0035D4CEB9
MAGSFDVLIIGNGVLGLSTANALIARDPEVRVAVIGPVARTYGASPAAGAMMGCFGEITRASVAGKYGPIKLGLGLQARKLWPTWLAALNAQLPESDRLAITPGTFVVANNRSGLIEDENFTVMRRTLQEYQERFEDVNPLHIAGMHPAGDSRPTAALFMPDEGSLDSSRLLAGLAGAAVRSSRVSFLEDTVSGLVVEGGRAVGVQLADGQKLSAKHVLLASGVQSQKVLDSLPDLARRVPRLLPGMGTSLVLETTDFPLNPSVIRTPNRAFACGLHVVPRGANRVYVGATNNTMLAPADRPTVSDVFFLMDCMMEQIHQGYQGAKLISTAVGNRPIAIDTLPLIGGTSVQGLWIASGTYRDGLFLSPLVAQHMAGLILGQGGLMENVFPPERKPINRFTREEAMEETARHYAAAGWEHGIRIPKVGWHETFARMFKRTITTVYEEIGTDYVLPPEFVYVVDNDRERMVPYFRDYYRSVDAAW